MQKYFQILLLLAVFSPSSFCLADNGPEVNSENCSGSPTKNHIPLDIPRLAIAINRYKCSNALPFENFLKGWSLGEYESYEKAKSVKNIANTPSAAESTKNLEYLKQLYSKRFWKHCQSGAMEINFSWTGNHEFKRLANDDQQKFDQVTHGTFSACKCSREQIDSNINLLCEENSIPTLSLSDEELTSLNSYVSSGYTSMNSTLRKGDPAEICAMAPILKNVESATLKFPVYTKIIYRGTQLPDAVLKAHQVGSVVKYAAFTSTSTDPSRAFAGWRFIISPKNSCHDISKINPTEQEVLCLPDTYFRIDERDDITHTIKMTEVDN